MTTTFHPAARPEPIPSPTSTPSARVWNRVPWNRAGLVVLLAGTAVLYLWHITINGMGNQFYAAAAQAGASNWEALLFGSLDAHNFITVDKPPLSQWVMGLSGQLFGFSSASMLIPQALMAVGAVALLHAAVARLSGPRTGLLAGAALALTPVAVLMFRFNNPDAAMVLLMTAAAYCTVRALDRHGARWLALAGVALGLAFLAKMLEGIMVAPALAAAYLVAAPVSMRSRLLHVLGAAGGFVASAGWFVVLTLLWPSSSRPYIAGSTDNNFMNLVLGYNGFARVLGRKDPPFPPPASGVGAMAGTQMDTATRAAGGFGPGGFGSQSKGITRLFTGEFGFEISWLMPAAVLAAALVVVARGGAPRTDPVRAAAILFGGWILVDGLVLSYMQGMIHPYYSLSIAPAVAAMFAIGVGQMWAHRESWWCRIGLAAMLLGTGLWSWWTLEGNAGWLPGLRWVVLVLTAVASLALLRVLAAKPLGRSPGRGVVLALLSVAVAGALAGPAAYAVATAGVPHQGGGPSVGPARANGRGMGMWGGKDVDSPELDAMLEATSTPWSAAIDRSSSAAGLELSTKTAVMAIGGFSGSDPTPTLAQFQDDVAHHRVGYYISANDNDNRGGGPWRSARSHGDIATWVAATFPATQVGNATVYDLSAPK